MLKLYYSRYTRSSRPRWLLEEVGAPYELVRLDLRAGDHKHESYLAIHPHGVVPALQDGDTTIYESVAICMYLADKLALGTLAPELGTPERALWYQWMAYGLATLEPSVAQYASHTRFLPEDQRVPAIAEDAKGKARQAFANLSRALAGREHLLGGFTAADVVIGSILLWAKSMKLVDEFPVLMAYADRLSRRPAWQAATRD
ncbi:MAG TPA: glutathione S-transferase family protein [Myxococcota bacterium]|nr:glutathione S-transferase family protein [Myxococcota bacterium]